MDDCIQEGTPHATGETPSTSPESATTNKPFKRKKDPVINEPMAKKRGRPKIKYDNRGKKIINPKEKPAEFQCTCCGKQYEAAPSNFSTTNIPLYAGSGGYIPICNACLCQYFENNVMEAFNGDELAAYRYMCGLMGWYYDPELVDLANHMAETNAIENRGKFGAHAIIIYGQRRNMKNWAARGIDYLDYARKEWELKRIVRHTDDGKIVDGFGNDKSGEIDERDVWFFGPGYTATQYRYLREQYVDWCDRYDCQTKAQEEIFKSIAIAQLNVQVAQQAGDQKKATDSIKTLQDLMDAAKIKPKQHSDDQLVEQNTFGTLIQRWENDAPIPEPREEWRDTDGIKRYIGAWFFGHLAKMFKLDNDWSRMYDEEIAEYTVTPPHVEKAENGGNQIDEMLKQMREAVDVDNPDAEANKDLTAEGGG